MDEAGETFWVTNSSICLPQCQSVWKQASNIHKGGVLSGKESHQALCAVRISTGLNSQEGKTVLPSIHQKLWQTQLGVDTVTAYEKLCRSDTTLMCLGMNMSDE